MLGTPHPTMRWALRFWPEPPWDFLLYGGMALMIVAPVVFYPFSKTIFLAFDLIFRPAPPPERPPPG